VDLLTLGVFLIGVVLPGAVYVLIASLLFLAIIFCAYAWLERCGYNTHEGVTDDMSETAIGGPGDEPEPITVEIEMPHLATVTLDVCAWRHGTSFTEQERLALYATKLHWQLTQARLARTVVQEC